jgi:hypothetical protein
MPHPFQDKLFVFMGRPTRGSRQTARDSLSAVGAVTDDNLTTFTDFVVAFKGAEGTKAYQRALMNERCGLLSYILSEDLFYSILDGKATLPDKPDFKLDRGVSMIPSERQKAIEAEQERVKRDAIEHKRIKSLAKHGVPTPEGRMKVDLRNMYTAHKFAEYLKEKHRAIGISERCMLCDNPAQVYISGEPDVDLKLCIDCNNRHVADLIDVEVPVDVPKHIIMNDVDGVPHKFEVELLMFPVGMTLIAAEVEKETRYRADVFAGFDKDFDDLWKMLIHQIEGFLSVKYIDQNALFKEYKAIGYVSYNEERDAHDVIIDGKPYTWQELEKNLSLHEGFRIKIEFADSHEILD